MTRWQEETAKYRENWPLAHVVTTAGGPASQEEHLLYALGLAPEWPGLVLEFGVGPGRTAGILARAVAPHVIHGFDSFLGLPEEWEDVLPSSNPEGRVPVGTFNRDGIPPEGLPENVMLHVGAFGETLPDFLQAFPEPARLVHIDCDIYSSTVTVLDALGYAGRIKRDTILAFDELWNYSAWLDHEWLAFVRACARFGWRWEVVSYIERGYQAAVKIL